MRTTSGKATSMPFTCTTSLRNTTSAASPPQALAAKALRRSRIWRAASCAALPFKSAPVEAAVADVLATLLVSVAHELGLNMVHVRASATDTSKVANTSATAAPTGADLNGKAAQDAARQIRERLAAFAAGLHGGEASDVRFAADMVYVGGAELPFAELVQKAYLARVQLWSDGFYATPGLHWDPQSMRGNPFSYFAYGAAVA